MPARPVHPGIAAEFGYRVVAHGNDPAIEGKWHAEFRGSGTVLVRNRSGGDRDVPSRPRRDPGNRDPAGLAAGRIRRRRPEHLAGTDLPIHLSLATPLAAAAVLLLLAALFDSIPTGWAGAILGAAVVVVLAVRVQQSFGDYIRDNHSTVLTNQNGFVLLVSGTVVALLCSLISVRRPAAQSEA